MESRDKKLICHKTACVRASQPRPRSIQRSLWARAGPSASASAPSQKPASHYRVERTFLSVARTSGGTFVGQSMQAWVIETP
jgi:hypothetical protein